MILTNDPERDLVWFFSMPFTWAAGALAAHGLSLALGYPENSHQYVALVLWLSIATFFIGTFLIDTVGSRVRHRDRWVAIGVGIVWPLAVLGLLVCAGCWGVAALFGRGGEEG